jgi:hypothetical protein
MNVNLLQIHILTCNFIIEIVCVLLDYRVCYERMWFLVFNERCTPRVSALKSIDGQGGGKPHFEKGELDIKTCILNKDRTFLSKHLIINLESNEFG